jgi:hypothetical protein
VNAPPVPGEPVRASRAPWLPALTAALVCAFVGWFAFERGQLSAGHDAVGEARQRKALADRVSRLQAENGRLNAKVAELEMARRLDRDAYGQVERTLGEMQSQLARQGDDLAFYRSIVSPADGVQGLRIQRFEVDSGATPAEFVLKLTLVQAMRHDSVVSGLVQVVVNGMQGDRPARLPVGDPGGRSRDSVPFSFRYFQTLEQVVTLPEGFQAFEVDVEARSGRLRAPIRHSFPWKVGSAVTL